MNIRRGIFRCTLIASCVGGIGVLGQANAQTPTVEEMWEIIQQQQATIEALQAQAKETDQKVEMAGEMIEEAASGGGASEKLLWGGYGEIHYNAGDTQEIDVHRFVLFSEYNFNDKLRLNTELELEHALAGDGKPGEVELEQAFIEWDVAPSNSLFAGVHLVPVGLLNDTHEPPTFFGVERDRVHSQIIPTTWWEAGVGSSGEVAEGLGYDVFVHSGLQLPVTGSSAYAIRSGRQKVAEATATDPAVTGRLRWSGIPGVNQSAAVQYQNDITQGTNDQDVAGAQLGIDAWLYNVNADILINGWGLRAMYAQWDLEDGTAGTGPANFGKEKQWGYLVEPSYRFPVPGANGQGTLGIFVRHSKFDATDGDNTDSEEQSFTFGANYWIHPSVVFKVDYDQVSLQGGTGSDRLNLGMGWQF